MPLNRAFIGHQRSPSEPFEVTCGDIRRFADAIGDSNPAYLDRDAARALGHPDMVAPPTFLISLGTSAATGLLDDPALGLDYSLVVHGEQHFALHRPICAGDVLETTSRIAEMRDIGRNEALQIVTEIHAAGEHVATSTNTLVSRGTAAPRES